MWLLVVTSRKETRDHFIMEDLNMSTELRLHLGVKLVGSSKVV